MSISISSFTFACLFIHSNNFSAYKVIEDIDGDINMQTNKNITYVKHENIAQKKDDLIIMMIFFWVTKCYLQLLPRKYYFPMLPRNNDFCHLFINFQILIRHLECARHTTKHNR